jgi:hypothetical protein
MAKAQRKRDTPKKSISGRQRRPQQSNKGLEKSQPRTAPVTDRPIENGARRKEVLGLKIEVAIGPFILAVVAVLLWHGRVGHIDMKQALEWLRRLRPLVGLIRSLLPTTSAGFDQYR